MLKTLSKRSAELENRKKKPIQRNSSTFVSELLENENFNSFLIGTAFTDKIRKRRLRGSFQQVLWDTGRYPLNLTTSIIKMKGTH